jgi:hypothetical protein
MVVQWGSDPTQLTKPTVAATSSTYLSTDLCGMPANNSGFHHPGVFFTAVLPLASDAEEEEAARYSSTGLVYFYRVGSDTFGWSAVESFKAPQPVNPNTPMNIIVTADMGETYGARFQTDFCTRRCHWITRMFASMAFLSGVHCSYRLAL